MCDLELMPTLVIFFFQCDLLLLIDEVRCFAEAREGKFIIIYLSDHLVRGNSLFE